ncbi:lytic transglycosylase domain-containing protein [Burkholderia contaminans]|uniref:lytic transglycosylase domain-containing protein n=1 Tax=Burkholderia contaminans TaxID=488447 RepID=UPI00145350E0|nr:lytic transglycosylase domain-containing protein [Burkholderia contaminans]VWD22441.1 transglycosylase [Burkholderia contaminans]
MLDRLYEDELTTIAQDRVNRPLPDPEPDGLGFWGTVWQLPKGIGAGVVSSGAFASDVMGAFGEVGAFASQADIGNLVDPDERGRREREAQAARQEIDSGAAFSTGVGSELHATARSMMPSPEASNIVADVLFGFGKVGVEAVGNSMLFGPIAGAAVTGAMEGVSEADRLKAEGVDIGTRSAVGAVMGAATAAGVSLPVVGKTLATTAGLVFAGGPATFIAQQAASRAILSHAGYENLTTQYDPFDPAGLAVATLLPAGFGALALRGARAAARKSAGRAASADATPLDQLTPAALQALRYDDPRFDAFAVTAAQRAGVPPEVLLAVKNAGERSASSAATSPKQAKGIMQFMDATWLQYGKGRDVRDPLASIDGAADMMADLGRQYRGNWRAAIAHYNGGGKAGEAVRAGKNPPSSETVKYLERTDRYIAERGGDAAGRAMANDPDAVAAAHAQLMRETVESWNLKDPTDIEAAQQHLAAVVRASDQMARGLSVDVSDTIRWGNLQNAGALERMISGVENARANALAEMGNFAERGGVQSMRAELQQLRASMPDVSETAIRNLTKRYQQERRMSFKEANKAARKEIDQTARAANERIGSIERQIATNRDAEQARLTIDVLDRQLGGLRAERERFAAPASAMTDAAVAARNAFERSEPRPTTGDEPAAGPRPASTGARNPPVAPQDVGRPAAKPAQRRAERRQAPAGGRNGLEAVQARMADMSAEIERFAPDMLVRLGEDGEAMALADAMASIRDAAERETNDAPLLRVAAECAIRNGV